MRTTKFGNTIAALAATLTVGVATAPITADAQVFRAKDSPEAQRVRFCHDLQHGLKVARQNQRTAQVNNDAQTSNEIQKSIDGYKVLLEGSNC
jgi:ParB-like chromosome segregation protein Spo0J